MTICHATPPDTAAGGYVMISPSAAGVYNGHLREHSADIIPPFTYSGQTYSENWDSTGQAIWNNGCAVPSTAAGVSAESSAQSKESSHGKGAAHTKGAAHAKGAAPTHGNSANAHAHVTICHATPPDTAANGYVTISPSASGVYHGHLREHAADIIPPFDYAGQTYSLNWDTSGQAIFANGCVVPTAATEVVAAAKTVAGAVLAALTSKPTQSAGVKAASKVKSGSTVRSGGVKGAHKTLARVSHRARPARAVTRAATFTG